jgi:hypothetical protein
MSTETTNLTTATPEDLLVVEQELERTLRPMSLRELAETLAFAKTAGQRAQAVKKYDPYSRYEVGDYISKEYNEPLTVGSKAVEHYEGTVILQVVAKTFYKSFDCEMLEVDYAGGGPFRKYIDYMKKTRTQVLLPANTGGEGRSAEILAAADDPRATELPMTERDLRALEKSLRSSLVKTPKFFNWNDHWQLVSKRVDIPADRFVEIEKDFSETRHSAATEDLVKRHLGLEPSQDLFDLTCLSLSYWLDKKHKKDFLLLADVGWGKWHLKKILNALPDGLALSAPLVKVPELEEAEKAELSHVPGFPIKVYLTWREILSGGLKVPRSLNKELSRAREYTFTDPEDGKAYTLYFYPSQNFFLGLQDFYAQHNIPQGTSLTLERSGPNAFKFWVKKSKKKISAPRLAYDPAADLFLDTGEEAYSFAEPNKIIFIERETLTLLLALAETREGLDLKDLLVLLFKDRAFSTPARSLHFLRAYHLVDIVRQTTQDDVEWTLLNSPEFSKSDKKKGVFTYEEPFVPKEEAPAEAPFAEAFPEAPIPDYLTGDIPLGDEELEAAAQEILRTAPEAVPLESPRDRPKAPPAGPAEPAKKDKAFKKKRPKTEGEKAQRPRKSERRVIEEKIEEEESVQAALSAIKEKTEERDEQRAKEKKEEFKPMPKEEPKFGIFADLLKTALKKKDIKKPEAEKK